MVTFAAILAAVLSFVLPSAGIRSCVLLVAGLGVLIGWFAVFGNIQQIAATQPLQRDVRTRGLCGDLWTWKPRTRDLGCGRPLRPWYSLW